MAPPELPGGALRRLHDHSGQPLASVPTRDLVLELRHRLRDPGLALQQEDLADQLGLLGLEIEPVTDVFANRFSRARVSSTAGMIAPYVTNGECPLDGATVLELGCGSLHPLGTLLVHVLCGARLAIGVDLDPTQDPAATARAMLRLALAMIAAPDQVAPWAQRTRAQVLASLEGFDLVKLWLGDPAGVDGQRLRFQHGPAEKLLLGDGEVDFCYSVSFLEHVPDLDAVVRELARVMKRGAVGVHSIDGIDHAWYGDSSRAPLDFLREPSGPPLVGGCNRLRPSEFVARFEREGFEVLAFEEHKRIEVSERTRAEFAEPWRSMPRETLEVVHAAIRVRRR